MKPNSEKSRKKCTLQMVAMKGEIETDYHVNKEKE